MEPEIHGKTEGNGNWEEVIAPIDCSYYAISDQDGPAWQKCSDTDDGSTCRNFVAGESFAITAPHCGTGHRWNKGARVTYVKSATPLSLYFLR